MAVVHPHCLFVTCSDTTRVIDSDPTPTAASGTVPSSTQDTPSGATDTPSSLSNTPLSTRSTTENTATRTSLSTVSITSNTPSPSSDPVTASPTITAPCTKPPPALTGPAPLASSTSTTAAAFTPPSETKPSATLETSRSSADSRTTSTGSPPTSPSYSPSFPATSASSARGSESTRVSCVPHSVLAGVIVSIVLDTAAAVAVLLRLWLHRRRASVRALRLAQNNTASTSATVPVVHSHSPVSSGTRLSRRAVWQRDDSRRAVLLVATLARPDVSGSQALPGAPPPLPVAEYLLDRPGSLPGSRAVSPDVAATTPGLPVETAAGAGAHGERLLHLALPWAFGQRVLAIMMAGDSDDARSVESGASEPLPAYCVRRERRHANIRRFQSTSLYWKAPLASDHSLSRGAAAVRMAELSFYLNTGAPRARAHRHCDSQGYLRAQRSGGRELRTAEDWMNLSRGNHLAS
ncbi:hypothetical protein VTO73DRAFT_9045 [Trametes versicolor]